PRIDAGAEDLWAGIGEVDDRFPGRSRPKSQGILDRPRKGECRDRRIEVRGTADSSQSGVFRGHGPSEEEAKEVQAGLGPIQSLDRAGSVDRLLAHAIRSAATVDDIGLPRQ